MQDHRKQSEKASMELVPSGTVKEYPYNGWQFRGCETLTLAYKSLLKKFTPPTYSSDMDSSSVVRAEVKSSMSQVRFLPIPIGR